MSIIKCGIIGNPVKHSLSPIIHRAFMVQTGQYFDYVLLNPEPDAFSETIQEFQQGGGLGLNVTLPFKQAAYQMADECSETAQVAQAASVLKFSRDRIIHAANYDGFGLVRDLVNNHHIYLQGKRVLILGAGGAVRGILGPLLAEQPAKITIANRTPEKAEQLVQTFCRKNCDITSIGLDKLVKTECYDVVIHATSVGHQETVLQLPKIINEKTFCYDLSYGQAAVPFLNFARNQGAMHCYDGLGMLIEHNAAVFDWWFGVYPDTQSVIKQIKIK